MGPKSLANGFWKPGLGLPIIFWQALLASAVVAHGSHTGPQEVIHGATSLANDFLKPGLRLPIIFWQALLASALVPHEFLVGATKLSMGPQA